MSTGKLSTYELIEIHKVMLSNRTKLDEHLKIYPSHQSSLIKCFETEEKNLRDDIARLQSEFCKTKEEIKRKIKELLVNKVDKLSGVVNHQLKYKIKPLVENHKDYQLLKKAITEDDLDFYYEENRKIKIHRVVPTDLSSNKTCISESSNTLLLHGTKTSNIEGILKIGFKPSTMGSYGPGVYLTDSYSLASVYGRNYIEENKNVKRNTCILVCEVNNSRKLQTKIKRDKMLENKLDKEPVVKTYDYLEDKEITRIEENSLSVYDSKKNRIDKGTFLVEDESITVAHQSLVIPSYLIEVQSDDICLHTMAKYVLYKGLKVKRFAYIPYKYKNSENKQEKFTFEKLIGEVEKELILNNKTLKKHIVEHFCFETNSVIKQLEFNLNSLFRMTQKDSYKHNIEVLKNEDKDYQYILSLIIDEKSSYNPNVFQIFKILPMKERKLVSKRRVIEIKSKELYLYGVKAEKVNSILKCSFTQDEDSLDHKLNTATTSLKAECAKGHCYCNFNNEVKEYSFVFVTSSKIVNKKLAKGKNVKKEERRMTNHFRNNISEALYREISLVSTAPEYLIIFEF